MKKGIINSIILGMCLCLSTVAKARQNCYRNSDCDEDQLCINTTCTIPESPLETCETADTCWNPDINDPYMQGFHMICDKGYCKQDGVYCGNPAGHGHLEYSWLEFHCECTHSFGGKEQQDPLLTDEELYELCLNILISSCGEKAPDSMITDACTTEQKDYCEGFYTHKSELDASCGQEAEDPACTEFIRCCDDVEQSKNDVERMECILNLPLGACEEYKECYEEGDESNDSSENSSESGCSYTPIKQSATGLWSLTRILLQ